MGSIANEPPLPERTVTVSGKVRWSVASAESHVTLKTMLLSTSVLRVKRARAATDPSPTSMTGVSNVIVRSPISSE